MKNSIRALVFVGIFPLASAAVGQGVAQPGATHGEAVGFHGNKDSLIRAIHRIQRSTGGRLMDIRFSQTNGMPGYYAVLVKHGRIQFIQVQEESGNITQIDVNSGPVWMLNWRGKADVHWAETAKVSIPQAIRTAEQSQNGAPALAAGIARNASSSDNDVHAYTVLVDVDGTAHRVAVDDMTGEIISDPSALSVE